MTKKQLILFLKEKLEKLNSDERYFLEEEIRALKIQSNDTTKLLECIERNDKFEENKSNLLSLFLLGLAPYPKKLSHKYELADMCDIDLDFSPDGRDKIKDYLRDKYGEENCVSIGTYGSLGVKGSIQEISRVYNIAPTEYLKVSKIVSDEDKDLEPDELRKRYPQVDSFLNSHPEVASTMMKLVGSKKSIGTHAGGFIVSSDSVFDNIPVVKSHDNWVSGWQESGAVKELEALGFIKIDVLGLAAVEQVRRAVKEIELAHPDANLPDDIYDVPVDDENVYKTINSLELDNIFQMESKVFVEAVRTIKPKTLMDISNISTLIRPGAPCSSSDYAKSALDKTKTPRCLWEVFGYTRGWLIYQEQLMQVLMELGGFDIFEADKVRRLVRKIGKSKTSEENRQSMLDEAHEIHKKYIKHATKRIVKEDEWSEKDSRDYAQRQWEALMGQAKYSFNAPHSVAYSLLGYVQGWIKTYYPVEFWVATLNTIDRGQEKNNQSSLGKYIHTVSEAKIRVEKPDVNRSDIDFKPAGKNGISFALSYIKDVSKGADAIIKNRPYKDWDEFLEKAISEKINKRVVKGAVFSGAADFKDDIEARPYKWMLYLTTKKGNRSNKKLVEEIEQFQKEWPSYFELIEIEYDYCKYSFTGIDEYIKNSKYKNLKTISERDMSKSLWSLAGYISDISIKKSKKSNNEYLLVTLTDFRDTLSAFAFGKDYKQKILSDFQKGQMVKAVLKNDKGWIKIPWEKECGGKFPLELLA